MKFLSKINPQKLVDDAVNGIDKAFFSNEEKAGQAMKIMDAQAEFVKASLNGSTVSSKTRRYIAVSIVVVFLLLVLGTAVAYLLDKDYAEFLTELIDEKLGTLVLMVAGFYFGGYMISNHIIRGFKKDKNDGK